MLPLIAAAAAVLGASALTGCGSADPRPLAIVSLIASTSPPTPVPPAEKLSTAAPAGVDSACEHARFSAEQLTGDWIETDGTSVTTLDTDYTLRSSSGEAGTWSYLPWASTPGKGSMPAGEENRCVLWLHWQSPAPPMDLVYVPLEATGTSLRLSFVGRGNTLTWVRPQQRA